MAEHVLPQDAALAPLPPGRTLRLRRGALEVELAPETGGRIAQIRVDGQKWLVGPDDGWPGAIAWGCYPMVPWAGRVRAGRFDVAGTRYQLPPNLGGHAIHGIGFVLPWQVVSCTQDSAELLLPLPCDSRWPFGGVARQRIVLADSSLHLTLEIQAGHVSMPVVLGWHPWFRKPARLQFSPGAMYPRDAEGIALRPTVAPAPRPWDDCFISHDGAALERDGYLLRMISDCTHWVVYDGTAHAICVEPQTGPPDAYNLGPDVLHPGQRMRVRLTLEWERA
ncbi:aldose epimerase [Stenotrophomonas sp. Marseille-Q4652]|uniref:aldose epimerase family protein n=1 Tax=Stenotrophomonas sp. Marseille-Q4652 TaxID=2866595 RepID=UPI001CE45E16|nr:aldose epimerase [Stenotrophomonas sp. Marseille-Q4652]